MAKVKAKIANDYIIDSPPATSPEAREDQLISLAYDLAEKQLREGTASSQVISEFIKMGTAKMRMEKEMMAEQIKLLTAKTEALKSAKHVEELYAEAMAAFRNYSGQEPDENVQ